MCTDSTVYTLCIRKQTGVRDIVEDINNSNWTWAGPIIRMEDNRLIPRLADWTLRTHNQMRGRPKTRWCDNLDGLQIQWEITVRDRRL